MRQLHLKSDKMNVNERIKLFRLSKNFTQQYMAEELGIDPTNYSRLENGMVKISTERVMKIADILDVKLSDLISEFSGDLCNELLIQILNEIKEINNKLK
jgi:transcriptional regulator with XRE-family HTH domain